ncbi:hypothetical protein GQ54DRAFT_312802 [Martensiomyces pterosporus]|nr:hypothetical protein GQ54DRAFT_312802 [Martensiomyces pterosporus]
MSAEMSATASPSAVSAAQPLREDIIESAVRFLTDPKVQSSTLAKKISFLETKGLTNAEIEDALARAKSQPPSAASASSTQGSAASEQQQSTAATGPATPAPVYGYAQQMAPPAPPPRPHLDWKDYFIAAVVAGGLGYGLYILAKKFISPLLAARDDRERLEEEKRLLLEQSELTRKQLGALNESTAKALDAMAVQSQKTNEAIEGMATILDRISTQETEHNASARRLQLTLEDLQKEVAALGSKGPRPSDTSTIADVQSDIRSLRSLLLSRRVPAGRPSTPTTAATASPQLPAITPAEEQSSVIPDPTYSSRSPSASGVPTPTIPAWQLGLINGDSASSGSSDKGKEAATA